MNNKIFKIPPEAFPEGMDPLSQKAVISAILTFCWINGVLKCFPSSFVHFISAVPCSFLFILELCVIN